MNQKKNRLIKCPYSIEKTWSVVKWALDDSRDDKHWWTIEEYREQGLLRTILNPTEELKREIVLNVSIIENERKVLANMTTSIDFYKMLQWVEVRIDEDIYPFYKRNEVPEPIIANTKNKIRIALKLEQ